MSKPIQKTQRLRSIRDKDNQDNKSHTPTTTQVSLTKYITHKELPATHIGPKDSKKRKKNSGEIPPDKRHHESQETTGKMDVNTHNVGSSTVDISNQRGLVSTDNMVNTENLHEHLNAMEQRLSCSITNNVTANVTQNLQGTINSFDTTLRTAMESMTSAVTRLIESNEAMIKHKETMDGLTQENRTLTTRINRLENEHYKLKDKVDKIENKELERTIILQGIGEQDDEDEAQLTEYVYYELSFTVNSHSEHERWRQIKEMEITRCKRLGTYARDKPRPIKVEFQHRLDVEYILSNKKHLRRGVYADKAYTADVEHNRRMLRPILKAARQIPAYHKRCRLDADELVILGKHYTIDKLNKLPPDLNVFNLTSKNNEDTIGYFGELNPLSNFHPAPFTVNGVHYICSEQFIQHTKAILFKDYRTAKKILNATTALECKTLSREIENFDKPTWESCAKERCSEGIKQKFTQNSTLRDVLVYCTGNKTIVESTSDSFWGSGVPLYRQDCLNPRQWLSNGIMGEILMDIRDQLRCENPHQPHQQTAPPSTAIPTQT